MVRSLLIAGFSCIAVSFVGCTSIKYIPKSTTIGVLNFKKYVDKGFLFTPHEYKGDYESIGLLSITVTPQAKLKTVKTAKDTTRVWSVDTVKSDEVLDILYEKAKGMGADAIIDFVIKEVVNIYNEYGSHPVTIFGFTAIGFAIKRKGAFIAEKKDVEIKIQPPADTTGL